MQLPERFGLIFDGWTCSREHYIAIYATYVEVSHGHEIVMKRLLSCGVQSLPDEDDGNDYDFGFTAEDIGDYISDVLSSYGKTFLSIEFLCGDNAPVNLKLCNLITEYLWQHHQIRRQVPLVGCACHRLNLAVQSLLNEEHTDNKMLVTKVKTLMTDLSTLKNTFRLGVKTPLCVLTDNATRWGSTYKMLQRYIVLEPILQLCMFSETTRALFPTPEEKTRIVELCESLKECEKMSKYFQSEDATKINMHIVRIGLDRLCEEMPILKVYISKTAEIIHSKDFENGIVKIQKGLESRLTKEEKSAVNVFLINADTNTLTEQDDEHVVQNTDLGSILHAVANEEIHNITKKSLYHSTKHVSPTSVVCETLFSKGSLIMTPNRRHMDPSTFEMLILLKVNRDMYDATTVEEAMSQFKTESDIRKKAKVQEQQAELARIALQSIVDLQPCDIVGENSDSN
ncbi:MAG: hypothetical protein Q8Q69_05650 [Nitrosopumilaceae archaeon]|nr:hypothetical protein [Nitrosopumilaceae archaeon]